MKKITIVGFFVILIAVFASCAKYDDSAAIKVGKTEIGFYEFRYEYNKSIEAFKTTYADRLSSMTTLDFSKKLDSQKYKDEMSWADYFIDYTAKNLESRYQWYSDALENGTELSQTDYEKIDDQIEYVSSYMAKNEITEDEIFGKDMTLQDYREILEKSLLGTNRLNEYISSLSYTYDDCLAFAHENKKNYFTASYNIYLFKNSVYSSAELAKKAADEFAKRNLTVDNFEEMLYLHAFTEDEKSSYSKGTTFRTNQIHSNLIPQFADWLFETDRKQGDVEVFADVSGYFVAIFVSCDIDEYNTVNYRRIFINLDTSSAVAKNMEEAENKASDIYDEWLQNGGTEEYFIELAKKNSDDKTTSYEGGLYTNIDKNSLSDTHNAWLFDENRKPGDATIVVTSSGYDILYYVGEGGAAWQVAAEKLLKSQDYTEYAEELNEKFPVKRIQNVLNWVK